MNASPSAAPGSPQKTPLPESARGLCWGGFLLPWLWAIFNRTWIGLLSLVPILGFCIQVLLLFKGRDWAWANKEWKSVEHFNRVQRRWSIAGLILTLGFAAAGIFAAIMIPNFTRFQAKAQQTEAKVRLMGLYAEEKISWVENSAYTDDLSKLNLEPSGETRYRIGFANSAPELREHCPSCLATENGFKAVAVGKIGQGRLDVWTIDQDKNLVNVIDGTK